MTTVSAKQFWNKGFICCCFVPLAILIVLQLGASNYWDAMWQTVILLLLCVNNHLLCENYKLKKELFEQLQVNLALIEYTREQLKKESENIK